MYPLIRKIIKHIDKISEYTASMEQSVFLADTLNSILRERIGKFLGNLSKIIYF